MTEPTTIVFLNPKSGDITVYTVGRFLIVHYNPRPAQVPWWKNAGELIKAVGPFVALLVKVLSWLGRH